MKAKKAWFDYHQPTLQGVHVAGSQDWGLFRVAALVRDQALGAGAMVRTGKKMTGPFIRPHGMIFNNDEGWWQRLTTELYADPCRVPDQLVGIVRFDDAARHALFHSYRRYNEEPLLGKSQRLQKEVTPPNPYHRGEKAMIQLVEHFELVENQIGAMLFMNDRLYATLILPDPVSYRQIHPMLVIHVFGESYRWQGIGDEIPEERLAIKAEDVADLAQLKSMLQAEERENNALLDLYRQMDTADWHFRPAQAVKKPEGLRLEAALFITQPAPTEDAFVGEWIVDGEGNTCYFKSTLMDKFCRRQVPLLTKIEKAGWRRKTLLQMEAWTEADLAKQCKLAGCCHLLRDGYL
ncbi:ARPP-2 domain-containing protein [Acanthopleuribacter pedis]|uniref:ARG and Rhodanese-Phosphatase-superfamily-associated domain-containing protein n=1 Tax=Acanthopleuribacter pedis TaxID=442870 RepID=A0A8J7QRZ5_9BACT|nr:hypothetical protein [Acanthopleuribacter pedis]MBO1323018.1 hypothetical protein [Acanthopleuribacter pedis]